MTAGLLIVNDTGTILLDENFSNVALVSKGTVTTELIESADAFIRIYQAYVGPALAAGERLAVACATDFVTVFQEGGGLYVVSTSDNAVVEWYRFGNPPPSTNNAGLRVYNAAGVLTFDSNHKHCRVFGSVTSEGDTTVGTSGHKYAVILARRGHNKSTIRGIDPAHSPSPYNVPLYNSTGVKVNGTAISFDRVLWNYAPTGALNSPGFLAYIVDVTGY